MRPLFEVVTPTANAAARRLTTAEKVRLMIGSPSGHDTLIESIIDRVSARAAQHCKLAQDATGALPTFGAETLRATYFKVSEARRGKLLLPWRVPVTGFSSIVEDGVTLAEGTDFEQISKAVLQRLSGDSHCDWSCGKIVVTFAAGWSLPGNVPPDLEEQVIDQVSAMYQSRDRDKTLKSETITDVGAWNYSAPGGSEIGSSGLLISLESALSPYKDWSQS